MLMIITTTSIKIMMIIVITVMPLNYILRKYEGGYKFTKLQ